MSITCKVIKGLMDPVILGWDFFCKYGVTLDAGEGKVFFGKGKSVPLIRYDNPFAGFAYRTNENLVLPANSLVHANAELVTDGRSLVGTAASCVMTDPFTGSSSGYCAARTCSNLHNNHFMTEFINYSDKSVQIPAGEVIGHAQLVDDNFLEVNTTETSMFCAYRYDG